MNIAWRLKQQAAIQPQKVAVKFPKLRYGGQYTYSTKTFQELDLESDKLAYQLLKRGAKRGDRVLLFMRPSLHFHAMVFALYKARLVPVMIDPGMGRKNLLNCIKQCKPTVMIAESEVQLARKLFSKSFENIKLSISTSKFKFGADYSLKQLLAEETGSVDFENTPDDELAAILFTSGGTGAPKGVLYTHGIFDRQTSMLQELFSLTPNDVDIPGFPLFSLFTLAMGLTSVIPDMDPRHPAKCNPEALVKNIIDNKATFVAGSPAIWERVAEFCTHHQLTLPTVKYVVMFGAPVRSELHEKFQKILPIGDTYTPYGATECLPVSLANGSTLLRDTKEKSQTGHGTCIGQPVPGVQVKIIKSNDQTISQLSEIEGLESGEIGEIIVTGPTVTPGYDGQKEATDLAKIRDGEKLWHRMGDVGYLDQQGQLWFCGRKGHVYKDEKQTKYSIPTEAIYNNHPDVLRTALITFKNSPALVVQLKNPKSYSGERRDQIKKELIKQAQQFEHTKSIETLFFAKTFPVDVRHNIKIDRKKLGELATQGKLI